jgi:hypothetical protein
MNCFFSFKVQKNLLKPFKFLQIIKNLSEKIKNLQQNYLQTKEK